MSCIKFIKTPNNKVSPFNGGSENDLSSFEKYLENLKLSKKDKKFIMGDYFLLNRKINHFTLMLDAHLKRIFQNYQSGPLSFEYFLDGNKKSLRIAVSETKYLTKLN